MFVIYGLYYVEIGAFCTHFLESFYHKWVLNFFKSFSCKYWNDHMVFILQFVDVVYHIDWSMYIEKSFHLGVNPTGSWWMILLMYYWICFANICWEFLYLCSKFLYLWPLDSKEIKPVKPKGNQSWLSIGRTDAEAEAPILWPTDAKSWLIGKDPDAGKDRRREKWVTEDEMVGWHHWLNGHEFEQTLGDTDWQGSLVGCSPWGRKELDTT